MPKVYRVSDLKRKHGVIINDLFKSSDEYVVVANENDSNKSFIISKPSFVMDLMYKLGYMKECEVINDIVLAIKNKVSKKYRDIRAKQ
jgi:hypothetical protein